MEKRNRKVEDKGRMVRKLAEKMVKNLKVNVASFAADVGVVSIKIGEEKETVLAYFAKQEQ